MLSFDAHRQRAHIRDLDEHLKAAWNALASTLHELFADDACIKAVGSMQAALIYAAEINGAEFNRIIEKDPAAASPETRQDAIKVLVDSLRAWHSASAK